MSMKRLVMFLALTAIAAIGARTSAMVPEQIKIDSGALIGAVGTTQPSVRAFKGIPFAAPPLGDNRWRAPQPAAKWDGVRKGDAFGNRCFSGTGFGAPAGRGRGAAPGAAATTPGARAAAPAPAPQAQLPQPPAS